MQIATCGLGAPGGTGQERREVHGNARRKAQLCRGGTSQNDRNKAQLHVRLARTEARQGVREAANDILPDPANPIFCGGVAEAENRSPPPPKKLGADDAPPKLHNEPAFREERRGRRPAAWRTRTISNSAPCTDEHRGATN
jgi:hypothetical protein